MEIFTVDLGKGDWATLSIIKTRNISISTLIHAVIQQVNVYALPLCDRFCWSLETQP